MVMDVKRAFFYGLARRPVFIKLPAEDPRDLVGRLARSMYGTRDAPLIWANEVKTIFIGMGFQQSVTNPSVYYHVGKQVYAVTHVDDFLLVGSARELAWVKAQAETRYEIKSSVLGPGPHEKQEVEFSGRCIRWKAEGFEYEADRKHVTALLQE